jgi:hypothetical protein
MFLKTHRRVKNGKEHCYYSIAENKRTARGVGQRQVLYLGEINDSQREAWKRAIRVFDEGANSERAVAVYTSATALPAHAEGYGVRVIVIALPREGEAVTPESFHYRVHRSRLRQTRRREGRYLLRTNLTSTDPAQLWERYLQLVRVEEAFRNLKGDLGIRPIYHQLENRVEAHVFISFIAFALHATLPDQPRPRLSAAQKIAV